MVREDAALLDDGFDGVPAESVPQMLPRREVEDQEVRLLSRFEAADVGGTADGVGRVDRRPYDRFGQSEPIVMAGQGPIVYFETDDIDAELAKVRELGGQAEDKQPIPGVGWFAGCKDPEGNAFSLFQSDESIPAPSA